MANLIKKLNEASEVSPAGDPKAAADGGSPPPTNIPGAAPVDQAAIDKLREETEKAAATQPPPRAAIPLDAARKGKGKKPKPYVSPTPPVVPMADESIALVKERQRMEAILAENKRLLARVAFLEEESAEQKAAALQAPAWMGNQIVEQYAGKETVRGTKQEVWWYKIDLPPSGGVGLCINGIWLYQGQVYKLTTDTLRTVKGMVGKAWEHEHNIKGNDENFYRPQLGLTIRGHDRGVRGLPPGTVLRG